MELKLGFKIIMGEKRMNEIKLEQKGGMGSNNTQILQQNNQYGLSYNDTKALCFDLIRAELSIYKDEALKIALERDERLLSSIVDKLAKEQISNDTVLEEFKNPDLQYTYVNAQKSFIRTGTDELEDVLSELLFQRIKENKRTLLQLALNESINIVPMLLPEQLGILSLCFLLRYTRDNRILSYDSLKEYLNNQIIPHTQHELKKSSLYQHIEYARCGQVSINTINLEDIFLANYKGLFFKGLLYEEIEELNIKYPSLFVRCLNDNNLWQINAIDESVVKEKVSIISNEEDKDKISNLFNQNIMSHQEIKDMIVKQVPLSTKLFDVWQESGLKNLTLTSVGIVIGAMYAKQVSGTKFSLDIWI